MKILIIGSGEIGTALSKVLEKKADISLWDIDPKKMPKPVDINRAILESSIIFLCVPSWANRDNAKRIADTKPRQHPIVISLSKGLEKDSGELMSEVLRDELTVTTVIPSELKRVEGSLSQPAPITYGILSGPMIAEDLMAGKPGKAVVALSDKSKSDDIIQLFAGTTINISISDDISGVSACGPLKNIYAMGLGIADGIGISANDRSQLINSAIVEMKKLVQIFGGRAETVETPAGVDDLMATSSSKDSSNYMVGFKIARLTRLLGGGTKGDSSEVQCRVGIPAFTRKEVSVSRNISKSLPYQSEGTISLEELNKKLSNDIVNFPLAQSIYDIIYNKKEMRKPSSDVIPNLFRNLIKSDTKMLNQVQHDS